MFNTTNKENNINILNISNCSTNASPKPERKTKTSSSNNNIIHHKNYYFNNNEKFFYFNNEISAKIVKYKSEICKNFEIQGFCPYGDKCDYAHGIHELRNINQIQSNKIIKCRYFFLNGFCLYGKRCQFSHKILNVNINKFLQNLNILGFGYYKKRLKIFDEITK
jgi:hypothetical protein